MNRLTFLFLLLSAPLLADAPQFGLDEAWTSEGLLTSRLGVSGEDFRFLLWHELPTDGTASIRLSDFRPGIETARSIFGPVNPTGMFRIWRDPAAASVAAPGWTEESSFRLDPSGASANRVFCLHGPESVIGVFAGLFSGERPAGGIFWNSEFAPCFAALSAVLGVSGQAEGVEAWIAEPFPAPRSPFFNVAGRLNLENGAWEGGLMSVFSLSPFFAPAISFSGRVGLDFGLRLGRIAMLGTMNTPGWRNPWGELSETEWVVRGSWNCTPLPRFDLSFNAGYRRGRLPALPSLLVPSEWNVAAASGYDARVVRGTLSARYETSFDADGVSASLFLSRIALRLPVGTVLLGLDGELRLAPEGLLRWKTGLAFRSALLDFNAACVFDTGAEPALDFSAALHGEIGLFRFVARCSTVKPTSWPEFAAEDFWSARFRVEIQIGFLWSPGLSAFSQVPSEDTEPDDDDPEGLNIEE